jgi:hypothetical protein
MLTKVEVHEPFRYQNLILPLSEVSDGVTVLDVTGLDPVKATISHTPYARIDGSQYQSSRREPRTISLKLGIEPRYSNRTVQEIRNHLYEYFMPKLSIQLLFHMSDNRVFFIDGRVESFETIFFTGQPEVNVSVLCLLPDFTMNDLHSVGGTLQPGAMNDFVVDYPGTVATGITFYVNAVSPFTSLQIEHRSLEDTPRSFGVGAQVPAGNKLSISTLSGDKSVWILGRDGRPILYAVAPNSYWIQLEPGANRFRVTSDNAAPNTYSLNYLSLYGGL